jgi:hypothetical protein
MRWGVKRLKRSFTAFSFLPEALRCKPPSYLSSLGKVYIYMVKHT